MKKDINNKEFKYYQTHLLLPILAIIIGSIIYSIIYFDLIPKYFHQKQSSDKQKSEKKEKTKAPIDSNLKISKISFLSLLPKDMPLTGPRNNKEVIQCLEAIESTAIEELNDLKMIIFSWKKYDEVRLHALGRYLDLANDTLSIYLLEEILSTDIITIGSENLQDIACRFLMDRDNKNETAVRFFSTRLTPNGLKGFGEPGSQLMAFYSLFEMKNEYAKYVYLDYLRNLKNIEEARFRRCPVEWISENINRDKKLKEKLENIAINGYFNDVENAITILWTTNEYGNDFLDEVYKSWQKQDKYGFKYGSKDVREFIIRFAEQNGDKNTIDLLKKWLNTEEELKSEIVRTIKKLEKKYKI